MKFEELNLDPRLLQAVKNMGFEEATPIQAQTIPYALEGRDVLGQAQTGTGKTAAFGLPLLEKIDHHTDHIQALVIAPTRELAIQNGQELYRLGKEKGVRTVNVYGGANIRRQIHQIKKGAPVVVGTPGRLIDLMKRKVLNLNFIETLVLDEADEMLNMGFIEDIETIIRATPSNRQTLLFSATMPKEIQRIGEHFMQDPVTVKIEAKEMTADTIDQYFTKCHDREKFDLLTRFIDVSHAKLAIVFARTKRRVDEVSRGLIERGYQAEGIHGDLSQEKRSSIMKDFKDGRLEILVATDVAARGLDISNVTHVYNYDIPQDPESYVHRIGRTGRAGKGGMSITFVSNHEMGYLRTIENLTHKKMSPLRPPTEEEAFTGQIKQSLAAVEELLEEDRDDQYEEVVNYLSENYTAEQLALAVVRSQMKDKNDVKVSITPERPLGRKRSDKNRGKSHSKNRGQHKGRNHHSKQRPKNNKGQGKSKHTGKNKRNQAKKGNKPARNQSTKLSFTIR